MLLQTIELPKEKYRDMVFHPNGHLLALNGSKEIIFLDLELNQIINKFEASGCYFSTIAFSNLGNHFVTVDSHQIVRLYDCISLKMLLVLRDKDIFDIAVDSKSGLIATSNIENNLIKLWNIKSNFKNRIVTNYKNSKSNIVFSPSGKILALGDYHSDTVVLLNVCTDNLTSLLSNIHSNGDLVFSPSGQIIAGESYYSDAAILFDSSSGKQLHILKDEVNFHNSEITCIAFSSDSKLVATGSYDLTIRVWDVETGKQVKIFEGHQTTIFNILFADKNKTLISASADFSICFWQI